MNICAFGCEQEGVKYFKKTKRWCCSESANKCPAKRERDASSKRGKKFPPERNRPWGVKPWNAGKRMSPEFCAKISKSLKGRHVLANLTPEQEQLRRQKISDTAKRTGNIGGYREKAGRTKWFEYESPIAGHMYLNGTWELAYATFLDQKGIQWCRNKRCFPYEWEGKVRKYTPDFFLSDTNEFVEIKGYVVAKDYAKWEALRKHFKLTVLTRDELIELGVLRKDKSISDDNDLENRRA